VMWISHERDDKHNGNVLAVINYLTAKAQIVRCARHVHTPSCEEFQRCSRRLEGLYCQRSYLQS